MLLSFFHFNIFFYHIEVITLGAGEEVDEVAGGAIGMGVDGIGEVGDWAAGVYGAGFTAGPMAGKGARDRWRRTGNKVNFDKELMEVGRMAD